MMQQETADSTVPESTQLLKTYTRLLNSSTTASILCIYNSNSGTLNTVLQLLQKPIESRFYFYLCYELEVWVPFDKFGKIHFLLGIFKDFC